MTKVTLATVTDPTLGSIAATVTEDGRILATEAAAPLSPNLAPYMDVVHEWAAELAAKYAEANPGHADWIARMFADFPDAGDH